MKTIIWVDADGYKHRSLLRDKDPDHLAKTAGIPADPPDLELLDWEGIKRDLNNVLVDRGLVSWSDVQAAQTGLSSAIVSVIKRRLIYLYRHMEE